MAWDKEKFRNSFHVQFHQNEPYDSSFSLIGIDAAVANAFRRILIAEIPTLASTYHDNMQLCAVVNSETRIVEYVFVNNNTSIIQDEVLSARLGLVPFRGGREGLLSFLKWYKKPEENDPPEQQFNKSFDYNTIVLHLKVECTRNEHAERGERDPLKIYNNAQ